ncbi:gap junction delta-4 protein [Sceloporus undulatus]|uniref:gap junction delta-4 protein n=1 Tax=Sceloporus undulatus TaxID=8520 RepID=UPI001C4ABF39|nr:gap junction delta-4 protein [Sceloporus undulatus]
MLSPFSCVGCCGFCKCLISSYSFNKGRFLQPNMECWDSLGFLIIALSYNVTIIGKIWLTLVILLRFMVIFLAAYPLYQDEQERFICNTLQPGCSNVCYDIFAPVSHFRFWLIQTVSILLPYAVFGVCVLHSVVRQVVKAYSSPYRRYKEIKTSVSPKVTKKFKGAGRSRITCRANEMDIPDFSGAYTVQLLLRILIEAGFGAGHYYLFGFFVPRRFSCNQSPCTSFVDCYISRPTEKSIMMLFIWGLSGFSFLLSLVDLVFAFRTNAVRNQRNKLMLEKFTAEEKCTPDLHQGDKPNKDLLGRGSTALPDNCGNCLLGHEVKEGYSFPPILTPQQTINSNLNSNSNKSCLATANPESKVVPFYGSEQPETSCEQPRCEQQTCSLKGVSTFKPQDGCHHRSHSSASSHKPSVHYSVLERKASDIHSVCSSAVCPKSKKSEWV